MLPAVVFLFQGLASTAASTVSCSVLSVIQGLFHFLHPNQVCMARQSWRRTPLLANLSTDQINPKAKAEAIANTAMP
jgi:hypothetical protein